MGDKENKFYMHPPAESHDAYKIWNDCCLSTVADQVQIYWALDSWVRLNAIIEFREKGPYITWYSPTGTRHTTYADTFARWFLCACREPPPPPPTPAITIPPESQENIVLPPPSPGTEEKLELFAIREEEEAHPLLQAELEEFLKGDS